MNNCRSVRLIEKISHGGIFFCERRYLGVEIVRWLGMKAVECPNLGRDLGAPMSE